MHPRSNTVKLYDRIDDFLVSSRLSREIRKWYNISTDETIDQLSRRVQHYDYNNTVTPLQKG